MVVVNFCYGKIEKVGRSKFCVWMFQQLNCLFRWNKDTLEWKGIAEIEPKKSYKNVIHLLLL